jgi:hypothetical protein
MNLLNVMYEIKVDFFRMLCWKHTLFKIQKIVWTNMTFIVDNVSKNMIMYNLWKSFDIFVVFISSIVVVVILFSSFVISIVSIVSIKLIAISFEMKIFISTFAFHVIIAFTMSATLHLNDDEFLDLENNERRNIDNDCHDHD